MGNIILIIIPNECILTEGFGLDIINTYQENVMEGDYPMARNKYPEVTVEKILDVAHRLFLEKGYDNTAIQDIVDNLDGLSKGAVYHHFKSKEEIMDAVSDRMFSSNNPFEKVRNRSDLNGLQKLRETIRLNQSDEEQTSITIQSIPLKRNPRLLMEMIEWKKEIETVPSIRSIRKRLLNLYHCSPVCGCCHPSSHLIKKE